MKRGLSSLIVCLSVLAAGCSTLTPWAAKVNGQTIDTTELDRELEAILSNRSYLEQVEAANLEGGVSGAGEGTFTTAFVGRILTRQIFFELIEQEFDRRNLTISAADEQTAADDVIASFGEAGVYRAFPEGYREDLVTRQAQVTALQADLAEVEVDAAAVQKFYDDNAAQFSQTCVSHILVSTAEEATALKARIDGGEEFAAAAAASIDPGSAANGGGLGCVAPGSFVPEFETAMDALAVGQVSAPVQTQFGFHLILVTDRPAQALEDVEPQIRQQLLAEGQSDFDAFVDAALAEAEIEVNPRYGRFDPDSAQPGIIPPQGPTPDADEVPVAPDSQPLPLPQG